MVSAARKVIDTRRFIYVTAKESFSDQYFHIYNTRLKQKRDELVQAANFRWGAEVKNVPLEQLNAALGSTDVFVIGTLFKLMPRQPSILRELEENDPPPVDPNVNYTCDEDSLILHETDENVKVVGDIDVHGHVTGIPVALMGHQLNGGAMFHVVDVCYAGLNLSVYKMPEANSYSDHMTSKKYEKMLIVSGLEFGFDSGLPKDQVLKVISSLTKLRHLIQGNLAVTSGDDCQELKQNIVKVIIAGNSIGPGYAKARLAGTTDYKVDRPLKEVFQLFDKYLYSLTDCHAEFDIMPGKNDPTSLLLPQQPFHPAILPLSGQLQNVHPNTNPCIIQFRDYTILGTSGENVDAIRQYSKIEYSTTILKHTLEWGHLAPNAPDNLSCLPFKENDPFIIDFAPDVYFAGNQHEFAVTTYATETKRKIQLISVPSFVKSQSCVIVDLDNLSVECVDLGRI